MGLLRDRGVRAAHQRMPWGTLVHDHENNSYREECLVPNA
jgi:hypothetical protein